MKALAKDDTARIRISATAAGFLAGTHAWQCPNDPDGRNGLAVRTMTKIKKARVQHGGLRVVSLTLPERLVLDEYIETWEIGVAENVTGSTNTVSRAEALGELNSARALRRQIDKAGD